MARIDTLKNFLTDLADKFRGYLGVTGTISHADYDTKIDEVYETGYDDGQSVFFYMLTADGARTYYSMQYGAFSQSNFTNYTFPTLIQFEDIARLFYSYRGTKLPGNIDFTKATNGTGNYTGYYQAFMHSTNLEEIVFNAPAPKQYVQTFDYCAKLKRLIGVNVAEETTFNRGFLNCYELEELTMGGTLGQSVSFAQSPLNKASIVNDEGTGIFNCMSDTASGKTLTLKLSAVKKAFETSEDANDGNTSEEWLNLVATKSNWEIILAA